MKLDRVGKATSIFGSEVTKPQLTGVGPELTPGPGTTTEPAIAVDPHIQRLTREVCMGHERGNLRQGLDIP